MSARLLAIALLFIFCCGSPARASIEPTRRYFGIHEPVSVRATPENATQVRIALYEGGTGRELAVRDMTTGDAGVLDLSGAFPEVFAGVARERVVYAQAFRDGAPAGAPLVIAPMTSPRVASDARTAAILDAFERGDSRTLEQIRTMTREQADMLAGQVVWRDPPARVCAGFRVYPDRLIELQTSLGEMTIALRHEAAPNTCASFMELVEGGFYTNVPFHRIVQADRFGRAFVVQAGDPGATGDGTPGFSLDFEPSDLPHDLGVVSMARELDDPNSNGSQFFICLSREGCARLDGRFVSFAEVIDGAGTLSAIAAAPVGPRDPQDPASARDRPLDPPMILSARTLEAPPIMLRPQRISSDQVPGVVR